jgi:hypothetical protein
VRTKIKIKKRGKISRARGGGHVGHVTACDNMEEELIREGIYRFHDLEDDVASVVK